MKKSKFSEEQIVGILEEAADGPKTFGSARACSRFMNLGVRELARAL